MAFTECWSNRNIGRGTDGHMGTRAHARTHAHESPRLDDPVGGYVFRKAGSRRRVRQPGGGEFLERASRQHRRDALRSETVAIRIDPAREGEPSFGMPEQARHVVVNRLVVGADQQGGAGGDRLQGVP